MALQHLKDIGKRFTYDKYGWDREDKTLSSEKEQYWIEYIRCDITKMVSKFQRLQGIEHFRFLTRVENGHTNSFKNINSN